MWPASPEEGQARGPVGGCKRHQVPAQSCQVGSWELVWRGPGLHCDVETDQGGSGKAWPGRCSGGVTCGQWAPRSPEAGGAGGRVIGRGRGSGAGRKDGETYSLLSVQGSFPEVVCVSCSVMSNSFATPWTAAHQAPLSMGFSRQEYWSGLPSLLLSRGYMT